MALNAASHNPSKFETSTDEDTSDSKSAGDPTGSVSGPPPEVSSETFAALKDEARKDSTGQNAAGQDKLGNANGQTVMGEAGKEKTAKESKEDSASI